jgi:hypothetical protein
MRRNDPPAKFTIATRGIALVAARQYHVTCGKLAEEALPIPV